MKLARPYAEKIRTVIGHLNAVNPEYKHPFLVTREPKNVGIIVVSSDRGLCGALNTNVFKTTLGLMKEWQGKGLEGAMIVYADKHLVSNKLYKDTVLTWIGDFNPRMLKVCQNLGTENYRDLATYRYLFDRTRTFERMPIIEKKG